MRICSSDLCDHGRKPCPCHQACYVSEDEEVSICKDLFVSFAYVAGFILAALLVIAGFGYLLG